MELDGKIAIVTGAGAGIGSATAQALARAGPLVVVADIDANGGRATVEAIEADRGRSMFIPCDVTSETDVRNLVDQVVATFGGLDILVNNAGGIEPPYFPESDPADWQRTIALNLTGVMLLIQIGVRAMRQHGGGAIVNISSMGGIGFAPYDKPEYGASKAGVIRLTASLTNLNAESGIRVNCICPGGVNTPAMERTLASMNQGERNAARSRPMLRPEQIADAVLMFVRDETMAGRVMLWPEGEPRQLIPVDAPY